MIKQVLLITLLVGFIPVASALEIKDIDLNKWELDHVSNPVAGNPIQVGPVHPLNPIKYYKNPRNITIPVDRSPSSPVPDGGSTIAFAAIGVIILAGLRKIA